jgi:hypothetical protein
MIAAIIPDYVDIASLPTTQSAAGKLSEAYLQALSAYWRGAAGSSDFEAWLTRFWIPDLHGGFSRPADAYSPHGSGGRGIDWYDAPDVVVGVIRGQAGGYRLPIRAIDSRLGRVRH